MTHICVGKLTIIGSDNGLSPERRQAIIWTNAGILLIGPLGTKLNEILVEIHTFSFKEMHLKMSSAKWRPFCLGLNVLNQQNQRGYQVPFLSTYKQLEGYVRIHPCSYWFPGAKAPAISIHSADEIFLVLEQFQPKRYS